jgi:CAAX protease family protein
VRRIARLDVSFAGHVRTIDSPGGRALSAGEFLLGAFIVIGHNVFHVVPNEVPILFVLGLVLVRWRNGGFGALGFKRPISWGRVLGIALVAAFVRIALGDFVIEPLASRFWPAIVAPAGTSEIVGNWRAALVALLIVWSFAAFGEEIAYRGYLTLRAAEAGGQSRMANWIAVFVVSILFGYGHYYKGPAGVLDSAVAGLILGVAFMISGRNLWAPFSPMD